MGKAVAVVVGDVGSRSSPELSGSSSTVAVLRWPNATSRQLTRAAKSGDVSTRAMYLSMSVSTDLMCYREYWTHLEFHRMTSRELVTTESSRRNFW